MIKESKSETRQAKNSTKDPLSYMDNNLDCPYINKKESRKPESTTLL
jgi:hypothetical protein